VLTFPPLASNEQERSVKGMQFGSVNAVETVDEMGKYLTVMKALSVDP
jgi:hypothetical protein